MTTIDVTTVGITTTQTGRDTTVTSTEIITQTDNDQLSWTANITHNVSTESFEYVHIQILKYYSICSYS